MISHSKTHILHWRQQATSKSFVPIDETSKTFLEIKDSAGTSDAVNSQYVQPPHSKMYHLSKTLKSKQTMWCICDLVVILHYHEFRRSLVPLKPRPPILHLTRPLCLLQRHQCFLWQVCSLGSAGSEGYDSGVLSGIHATPVTNLGMLALLQETSV